MHNISIVVRSFNELLCFHQTDRSHSDFSSSSLVGTAVKSIIFLHLINEKEHHSLKQLHRKSLVLLKCQYHIHSTH